MPNSEREFSGHLILPTRTGVVELRVDRAVVVEGWDIVKRYTLGVPYGGSEEEALEEVRTILDSLPKGKRLVWGKVIRRAIRTELIREDIEPTNSLFSLFPEDTNAPVNTLLYMVRGFRDGGVSTVSDLSKTPDGLIRRFFTNDPMRRRLDLAFAMRNLAQARTKEDAS